MKFDNLIKENVVNPVATLLKTAAVVAAVGAAGCGAYKYAQHKKDEGLTAQKQLNDPSDLGSNQIQLSE